MTGMKLLLVEDEARVAEIVRRGLVEEGHQVDVCGNGRDALGQARDIDYDVIVLDWMLPGIDGLELLRQWRTGGLRTPVLMLTARGQVGERVAGLKVGADDYLVKPFAFGELLARIMALSRRRTDDASPVLVHGRLQLDTAARVARVDDAVLTLTPKEYALLELLVHRKGHVLSRAILFSQLYESNSMASDTVIEALMCTLRGKMARAGLHNLIDTRRGFGYVVD